MWWTYSCGGQWRCGGHTIWVDRRRGRHPFKYVYLEAMMAEGMLQRIGLFNCCKPKLITSPAIPVQHSYRLVVHKCDENLHMRALLVGILN